MRTNEHFDVYLVILVSRLGISVFAQLCSSV